MSPTIEALRVVARRMESLEMKFVFLGGSVIELLVDHPSVGFVGFAAFNVEAKSWLVRKWGGCGLERFYHGFH